MARGNPARQPETVGTPSRTARVPAAETPRAALASPILVAATIVAGLYFGREIFIPIAIALLLSFVLSPLVHRLRRLRVPRVLAVGLTVLMTLGIVGALAALIGIQVADLSGDIPRYRATVERKLEALRDSPAGHAAGYVANIGRAIHTAGAKTDGAKTEGGKTEGKGEGAEPPRPPEPQPAPAEPDGRKPILVEMAASPPGPLETASTLLAPVLQPLATAGIVFVVLLFVLMQREDLRDRMIRLAGSSDLHRTTVAMDDAAKRLSRYFVAQLALNAAFGVVIGIGLYVIGVPNPVLWAIFSALMRFVPYLGAFLSALLPMALAAAVEPGWNMTIATALLFVILEPIAGQVIEPIFYGQSTGLSPIAVLVSALFWTWLWGPVGLLLSTPLTVCLVVLGRHVEHLEFLDVLFGDRPALTPVQNVYQRILAGDSEEVLGHAELTLQQCSLSSYYDDVVLKALELAARDAARGVLTARQKAAMRSALGELIDDLADRADAAKGTGTDGTGDGPCSPLPLPPAPGDLPEAWTRPGAVLCVSGRGFLDEAAAAILAQILEKRGVGTRTVPFAETASARIGRLEPGPARLACIVSLAPGGEPRHLRRLVRRLGERMPGVPRLVGLWLDAAGEQGRGAGVEADRWTGSLRDTVEAVLAAAQDAGGRPPAEAERAEAPARAPAEAGA
ncbi:AI-2E family transporter [Methylobacterium sp. NEAU 140]|uniref:AI-2E family transporter n=1 Tax=Methylobacterium sp. NEAU 140 TaxID=3064945 RepID=UPI0027354847|nr:AI-2E family transporter [Methylobacterium sp. NEAU 140]MDP4022371.1 AI-2E family transporter [Methylobacterium sp. NEAU 140]